MFRGLTEQCLHATDSNSIVWNINRLNTWVCSSKKCSCAVSAYDSYVMQGTYYSASMNTYPGLLFSPNQNNTKLTWTRVTLFCLSCGSNLNAFRLLMRLDFALQYWKIALHWVCLTFFVTDCNEDWLSVAKHCCGKGNGATYNCTNKPSLGIQMTGIDESLLQVEAWIITIRLLFEQIRLGCI